MSTGNVCDYSPFQNSVLVGGALGTISSVVNGNLGDVLTAQGAGNNPNFMPPGQPPIGTMSYIANAASPPTGAWLPCDGSTHLQATYPALYAQLGLLNPRFTWASLNNLGAFDKYVAGVNDGPADFVYVGTSTTLFSQGVTLTSVDGYTSGTRTTLANNTSLFCVAFGSGKYVAAGDTSGSALLVSCNDGISWVSRTSNLTSSIQYLAYGNGVFLAQDISGNQATSADGITWVKTVAPAANFNCISFYGNYFLGWSKNTNLTNTLYISSDGILWYNILTSNVSISPGSFSMGFAYQSGTYLTFLYDGNLRIYRSLNGTTWNVVVEIGGPYIVVPKLISGGGSFVFAYIEYGGGVRFYTSVDGVSWAQAGSTVAFAVPNPEAFLWNGTQYLLFGNDIGGQHIFGSTNTYGYNSATSFVTPTQDSAIEISSSGVKNRLYIRAL